MNDGNDVVKVILPIKTGPKPKKHQLYDSFDCVNFVPIFLERVGDKP
jgi:hypothetical protein